VVRWRCIDLRDEIAARWSVNLNERTVRRASPNLFSHWRFVRVDDRTSGAV